MHVNQALPALPAAPRSPFTLKRVMGGILLIALIVLGIIGAATPVELDLKAFSVSKEALFYISVATLSLIGLGLIIAAIIAVVRMRRSARVAPAAEPAAVEMQPAPARASPQVAGNVDAGFENLDPNVRRAPRHIVVSGRVQIQIHLGAGAEGALPEIPPLDLNVPGAAERGSLSSIRAAASAGPAAGGRRSVLSTLQDLNVLEAAQRGRLPPLRASAGATSPALAPRATGGAPASGPARRAPLPPIGSAPRAPAEAAAASAGPGDASELPSFDLEAPDAEAASAGPGPAPGPGVASELPSFDLEAPDAEAASAGPGPGPGNASEPSHRARRSSISSAFTPGATVEEVTAELARRGITINWVEVPDARSANAQAAAAAAPQNAPQAAAAAAAQPERRLSINYDPNRRPPMRHMRPLFHQILREVGTRAGTITEESEPDG